jgi:nicotinamide-nucleotide amidase
MTTAEIVAVGSELLLGQIVDTNSAWMAQRLTNLGVDLYYKTVVGDNPGRMKDVIGQALERSDLVITGGGLGPTQDDITREIIAEVTGRKLVRDPDLLDQIESRFRRRGFTMTANNERQADIPEGATPVHNPNGTAPSFIVEDARGVVFALPGVPFELKWLFDNEVAPYLRRRFELSEIITYRVLKVADIGESAVDDLIGHLIAGSSNPTVGVLAHPGQVDVRIAAKAGSEDEAARLIAPLEEEVRGLLGRHVFAADQESMEDVVGALLRESNSDIAVYEDLTGGLVAERLLQAGPESFLGGVIGNGQAPVHGLLETSERPADPDELAKALARAVRGRAGADLGLALHGIPDPSDEAENLARGRTVISITDGSGYRTRTYNSGGRGKPDRTRMSLNAIELVRLALVEGMDEAL